MCNDYFVCWFQLFRVRESILYVIIDYMNAKSWLCWINSSSRWVSVFHATLLQQSLAAWIWSHGAAARWRCWMRNSGDRAAAGATMQRQQRRYPAVQCRRSPTTQQQRRRLRNSKCSNVRLGSLPSSPGGRLSGSPSAALPHSFDCVKIFKLVRIFLILGTNLEKILKLVRVLF